MAPSKDDSTHRIRVRDAYNAPERGKSHAFSPSFMIEAVKTRGRTATTYFATTCQVRDREREKERHKGTKGIRRPNMARSLSQAQNLHIDRLFSLFSLFLKSPDSPFNIHYQFIVSIQAFPKEGGEG